MEMNDRQEHYSCLFQDVGKMTCNTEENYRAMCCSSKKTNLWDTCLLTHETGGSPESVSPTELTIYGNFYLLTDLTF